MQRCNLDRRRLMAAASVAVLAAPSLAFAERVVTFGLTPVFLDSDIQLISQIETYLTKRIGRRVQLVKRRTYQEITALLVTGQLDAAWICGFPFVQNRDRLALVATPLYRGEPLYRSYLITRVDSAATEPEHLRGDIHAFSDPESNSGFLVTSAWLAERQRTPADFFTRTFFTFGHRNVIRAVAAGLARSGSVDGYVWDVMGEIEPALVEATRVLRVSEPMGFPPVAAARLADPGLVGAFRQALTGLPGDPLGRTILAILRLDGFAETDPSLFDGIDVMWRRVRALA